MAVSELYVCDQCQHDIVLVHAEEWQPGQDGEDAHTYPGWGAVGGLWNRLWCPTCREVKPYIFLRLNPPGDHPVVAFAEAQRLGATGRETGPCPACSTPLTWQVEEQSCPECSAGQFRFAGEWEAA